MAHDLDRRLKDLRRRLANARRRAAYWSGRPNMYGYGFKPGKQGLFGPDEQYEMAMSDVQSLAGRIEELTGERPATTDYQREFRAKFSKMKYAAE